MLRRYGHRFGAYDARDKPIAHLVGAVRAAAGRPDTLSLEQYFPTPLDQGDTSSCEAHATSAALVIRAAVSGAPIAMPSRAALYAMALEFDNGPSASPLLDVGTFARSIAYALATDGVCSETRWPFAKLIKTPSPDGIQPAVVRRPPWDALQNASDARVTDFAWVLSDGAQRCEEIRDALAKGFPVVYGMPVDAAFEQGGSDVYTGLSGPSLGGHCLCIVGFRPGAFRVLNSWGSSWQDGGRFWISDACIGSAQCSDFLAMEVAPQAVE